MRIMIKVIRVLLAVVLCAVILLNGWMLVQKAFLHRDAPEIFGYSQYIVTSGSMEPLLPTGAIILVKEQPEYGLGDVVAFRSGGAVITHRLVGTVSGQFITQGDANNTEDPELLAPENILGKVQCVVGGPRAVAVAIGKMTLFFRTPLGLLLLLAVGLLLIKLPDWVGALKTRAEGRHAR